MQLLPTASKTKTLLILTIPELIEFLLLLFSFSCCQECEEHVFEIFLFLFVFVFLFLSLFQTLSGLDI